MNTDLTWCFSFGDGTRTPDTREATRSAYSILFGVLKKNDKDQDCLFSAWKNPRHEGNCRKCFAGVLGKITKINTTSLLVVVIVVSEQRKLPEMLGQGALRKKSTDQDCFTVFGWLSVKTPWNQFWRGFYSSEPLQVPTAQSPRHLFWRTFLLFENSGLALF